MPVYSRGPDIVPSKFFGFSEYKDHDLLKTIVLIFFSLFHSQNLLC